MGNCVSAHKNSEMKLAVRIESPTKENAAKKEHNTVGIGHPFLPQKSEVDHVSSFRDLSSKEEIFFESHAWLESDCEDYFSVNGDITPCCGDTPINQKSLLDSPQLNNAVNMHSTPNSIPDPSPTDMKKQLIELFRESFSDDPRDGNQNLPGQREAKPTILALSSRSTNRSPYESVPNSVSSSERTPYGDSRPRREKSPQSAQCCIPSLMRSLSFTERKKRLSSATTGGL